MFAKETKERLAAGGRKGKPGKGSTNLDDLTGKRRSTEATVVDGDGRVDVLSGNGRAVSVGELAALCLERIGTEATITCQPGRARPTASEVGRLQCDAQKAGQLLGWTPTWTLEEGLDAAIAFHRLAADPCGVGDYVL